MVLSFVNSFFGFFNFLLPFLCTVTFQLLPFCPLCPCFRLSDVRALPTDDDGAFCIAVDVPGPGGQIALQVAQSTCAALYFAAENIDSMGDSTYSCGSVGPPTPEITEPDITKGEFESCYFNLEQVVSDNMWWDICFA